MVEISLSGSGEGPGRVIARGYSTADGIDVAYAIGDTSMLDRFANALACYPKDEVVLWGKVHALRGRVLLDRLQRRDCAESELAAGQLAEQLAESQLSHWNRGWRT